MHILKLCIWQLRRLHADSSFCWPGRRRRGDEIELSARASSESAARQPLQEGVYEEESSRPNTNEQAQRGRGDDGVRSPVDKWRGPHSTWQSRVRLLSPAKDDDEARLVPFRGALVSPDSVRVGVATAPSIQHPALVTPHGTLAQQEEKKTPPEYKSPLLFSREQLSSRALQFRFHSSLVPSPATAMDEIMKVLDHTVREIKREVNLRVLKVPEIEQKVLDATSDEPWGPHGSDLADIARATSKLGECRIIMAVLWQRLGNTDANWRHLYKALAVVEYLLANGTERAVEELIENSSQIARLARFEFVEPNGKDVGLNVRKKAETVLAIVDDREKLQQVREKAAATRDKYLGLSSTGMSYRSSAASFGNRSYSSGSRTGGGSRETASFRDSYTGTERSKSSRDAMPSYGSTRHMSKETTKRASRSKLEKGGSKSLSNPRATSGVISSEKAKNEDEGDDFNPRGSSTSAGTANVSSNDLDLFGPNLMDDLVGTDASTSTAMLNLGGAAVPKIDLFADANFQSATASGSDAQDKIDLFAGRSSFGGSTTSDTKFSVRGTPEKYPEQKSSSPAPPSASAFDPFQPSFATLLPSDTKLSSVHNTPSKFSQENSSNPDFDPFAAIALRNFDGSDSSGAFSSSTRSAVSELAHDSPGTKKSSDYSPLEELNFDAIMSRKESCAESATESMNKSLAKLKQDSMSASKPAVKKETFQVKSGIWADSLSRGLIDLNIAAPKKVDLSDIGIVGRLSDGSEEKSPAVPWYMEAATGTGSDLGRPDFPSSTGTAGGTAFFQQQQQHFGNFR